jgi:hypothetical protein
MGVFVWTLSAIFALVMLGSFSYELFFGLSVVGFLALTALVRRLS